MEKRRSEIPDPSSLVFLFSPQLLACGVQKDVSPRTA